MFDDKDLISVFLEESKENLQSMEDALLELEKAPENNELLSIAFRSMHTIKGGAGLMGLELINNLAHRLENILDEIRQPGKKLPAGALDLLFKGVDFFRQIFASGALHGEGFATQAGELLEALHCFTGEKERKDTYPPSENQIFSKEFSALNLLPHEMLEQTAAAPGDLYQVNVRLYPDCLLKSVRAYMVLKNVEKQAQIIKVEPSLEDLEKENFETIVLTIISRAKPQELQELIENISEIEEVQVLSPGKDVKNIFQEQMAAEKIWGQEDLLTATPLKNTPIRGERIDTIRVETSRLENILNNIAELLIAQSRIKELYARFSGHERNLEAEASHAFQETDKIIRGLQEDVMKISMVPVSNIFGRFRRLVRDLAREKNKDVELVIEGEETELDKKVIEQIADPLKHLIRNALDHGLESPEERTAQGKKAMGTIKLEAFHQEGNVIIKISDDGRGIDEKAILKKALEKGLVAPTQEPDTAELHRLLFEPGFSTALEISDLSGRGVGLDVVQHNIQNLHGSLEISSEKGRGTSFHIKLPLTQAIIDGMMVRVGAEHFILPLVSITEFIKAQPGDIRRVEGKGAVLCLRQEFIPYAGLYQYLGLQPQFEDPEAGILVIIQEGRKKLALLVDDILGQEQVVIKNIAENMGTLDGIAGATILGNGRVAMILDISFLFRHKSKLETGWGAFKITATF